MAIGIKIANLLSILLSNSYSGYAQQCATSQHENHTLTSASEIGPSMEGEDVVITTKITVSDLAACTAMFCDESNPCCNQCNGGLQAGDINLLPGGIEIGCSGTNCDWESKCTYQDGDTAVIYGKVGDNGTSIYVNDRCLLGSPNGVDNGTDECGMPREGYTETTVDSLAGMVGESVMLTSSISMNTAICTIIFCGDDNQCCNSCYAEARFGNVSLISDTYVIGCPGTNCDYEDNCIYHDNEVVTVYGNVNLNYNRITIQVDDHCLAKPRCTDVGDIDFGLCFMHMGYGVSNGVCAPIGGCGTSEHVFFTEMEDCKTTCSLASCEDHAGVDYGKCKMMLGYGVVDGVCQGIGGCNRTAGFFDSMAQCEKACVGGVGVMTTSIHTNTTNTKTVGDVENLMSTNTNAGYEVATRYPLAVSASLLLLSFVL